MKLKEIPDNSTFLEQEIIWVTFEQLKTQLHSGKEPGFKASG